MVSAENDGIKGKNAVRVGVGVTARGGAIHPGRSDRLYSR